MSKVIKGAHKFVKKVHSKLDPTGLVKKSFKLAGKVFKKVWNNPIGRIATVAVAAYFTAGLAAGAWSSFAGGGGAAGGAGATAAGTTTATATGSLAAPASSTVGPLASGYGFGGAQGIVGNAMNTTLAGGGNAVTAGTPAVTAAAPATSSATPTAVGGIVNTVKAAGPGVGRWVKKNPLTSAMLMQGIGNALTPSAAEEQWKYDEKRRKRREEYLNVGSINLGVQPSGEPLRNSFGNPVYNPAGIINRTRSGG